MNENKEPIIQLRSMREIGSRLLVEPSTIHCFDGEVVRQGRAGKGFVADAKTNYSPELMTALDAV